MAACTPHLRVTQAESRRLGLALYEERPDGPWVKTGFACGTCKFFTGNGCNHPKVNAPVRRNGCCEHWRGKSCYRPGGR